MPKTEKMWKLWKYAKNWKNVQNVEKVCKIVAKVWENLVKDEKVLRSCIRRKGSLTQLDYDIVIIII
jgi:hypothetical protein